jgi:diacylglycerol kinase
MEKSTNRFSLAARLKSFSYAIQGIIFVIRYEHNARIHLFFSVLVILSGFLLKISRVEWVLVLLCIAMVIITEMINTIIEKLVDLVSPQKNDQAGIIKDISAAVVLFSACIAVVAGIIIFLPHVIQLFK